MNDCISSLPLSVRLWVIEEYQGWQALPPLIDLAAIQGQLGRTVVSLGTDGLKAWATIALKKVCLGLSVQHILIDSRRRETL